jgi:signal peptidase I
VLHYILERSDTDQLDNTRAYKVPPGHYFAMGDNRDNSLDSRVLGQVGFIPAVNLIGRAEFLFFSVGGDAAWWEFWAWVPEVRWQRFFKSLSP